MKVLRCLSRFPAAFILSCALSAGGSASAETLYQITDLGDLPGGNDSSSASAISDSGLVAGSSGTETGTRAFLWDSGVMTDLGDLPGGDDVSTAYGINDAGQVVGRSENAETGRAFLWEGGAMTDLGDLPGQSGNANAEDINAAGQVVGRSVGGSPPGGVTFGQATLWEPGSGDILGLGDLPGGRDESYALAINDAGQVVGKSEAASGLRAFFWEPGDSMVDLGELPGGEDKSIAHDINNAGLIVGESEAADGQRAFLWDSGTMTDLGHLGGPLNRSMAYAINEAGQVAGLSNTARGDAGFIWDAENGMRNLNDLIDPDDPVLAGATHLLLHGGKDINEAGQIVGQMSIDGVRHAYLLTPMESADQVWVLIIILLLILLLIILILIYWRNRSSA